MALKKNILIICIVFFLAGCATSGVKMTIGNVANALGGEAAAKNKNPLIETEIDITLINEIASMVKLNQAILDRIPISYEDNWPELLNDYYKTKKLNKKQKRLRRKYNKCLYRKLKKDFYFFKLYNLNAYAASIISSDNIFYSALGALGSRMFIEGCKDLGIEYEHAKLVLSYVPFGCECGYFKPEFMDIRPGSKICTRIKKKWCFKKCDFFNRPTEVMLTKYLFRKGGMKHWADIPIKMECFRPVKGEQIGTFREAFYSILSPSIRNKIKRIDEETFMVKSDLEEVKAKLQDKKIPPYEKAALQKKKRILSIEFKNKKKLQEKLYKQALSTLYVTPENIKKAKKLKEIADYIHRSFMENMGVMTNLTVKIINDVSTMKHMNLLRAFVTYPFLVKKGVFTKRDRKFYENRFKRLAKNIIVLPITYAEVLGYSIAQEYQVSKYRGYLKAMIKMEQKLKK